MSKLLTESVIEQYHTQGYYFPIDVLSLKEANEYRKQMERLEAQTGKQFQEMYQNKPHLLFPWLDQLIRHPKILDAAEDVLGPNILCWASSFFIKEANDANYVSWHQDSTYWGLSRPDVITAWIGFTDSTIANGCMRVIPKTHGDQIEHKDTFAKNNLLSRGQEVEGEVAEKDAVDLKLSAGQMSLHHVRLVHGSNPNETDDRRIGFAIRYIPTDVRQINGPKDFAMLVRGEDHYHFYELEPSPKSELAEDAVAYHAMVRAEHAKILYKDAAIQPN